MQPRRALTFSTLLLCFAIAFSALAYPLYVIQPFRYQSPRELSVALAIVRYRPPIEILFCLSALVILAFSWRTLRTVWPRVAAALCALLVLACAILSRINIYELMFHPLGPPSFAAASESKLNDAEQVIAVKLGPYARAYPIRSMSYHHVVNDVLNGVPIVATY